jgi:hypothetical protein
MKLKYLFSFLIGFAAGSLAMHALLPLIVQGISWNDYVLRAKAEGLIDVAAVALTLVIIRQAIADPSWIAPMLIGTVSGITATFLFHLSANV